MRSAEVDAYIARAAPFARPILRKIRRLFHQACPAIEEKIKWGVPSFERRGRVGGCAAFKHHATFGLWRQDVLPDPQGLFRSRSPMGCRITDVSELPSDRVILSYIRAAVKLNEEGAPPRARPASRPPARVPPSLLSALRKNPRARAAFEAFPPSHKREYAEWIAEAKQEETRRRRLATAIEWMAQGKPRNWKYMKK
jgi:uncharacterized protein YdeI (YjbR/CyaY-like superfamily)